MRRTTLTASPFAAALQWPLHIKEDLFEVGGSFSTSADGVETVHPGQSGKEMQAEWGPGMKVSDALLAMEDKGWYTGAGRESHAEAEARAEGICEWLWSEAQTCEAPSEVHLSLVIHGDLLGMVLRKLMGCSPSTRFLHLNTAYTLVDLNSNERSAALLSQNSVNHLEVENDKAILTGAEMMRIIA